MTKTLLIPASIAYALMLVACGGDDASSGTAVQEGSAGSTASGSSASNSTSASSSAAASGSASGSTSSSASSSSPNGSAAAVAGIYAGPNMANGLTEQDLFLVLPDGNYSSISVTQATGCATVGIGTITASSTNLQGTLALAFDSANAADLTTGGCVFSDGSTDASGFINGTLSPGSGINLNVFLTTENGAMLPTLALNLPLSPLYAEPGPLSKLQGTYLVRSGEVLTIDANGVATLTGSPFGCVVNELYSQVGDGSHNIYTSSAMYSGCTGADEVLNGQTVNGTFTLDDRVTPTQLNGVETVSIDNGSSNPIDPTSGKVTYLIHVVATMQ